MGKVSMLLDLHQYNRALSLYFEIKRTQLQKFSGFVKKMVFRDFEKFKKIIESVKVFFVKCLEEVKDIFDDFLFVNEHFLEFSEFFRDSMRDLVFKFTQHLSEGEEREFYNELEYMLEGFNSKGLSIDHLFEKRIKEIQS